MTSPKDFTAGLIDKTPENQPVNTVPFLHLSRKTLWNRPLLWVGLGVLSLGVVGTGLISMNQQPSAQANQGPSSMMIPVTLAKAETGQVMSQTEFMAELSSDSAIWVQPQVSGRIVKVLVQDGELVHAGQPLFQLDSRQQAHLVQSLKAVSVGTSQEIQIVQQQMAAQNENLKAAQAELAYNKTQQQRYETLSKTHSVSAKEVEQFQTAVQQLEAKLHGIEADLQASRGRLEQTRANIQRDQSATASAAVNLEYYTVKAPFTGQIGEIMAKVGDTVDVTSTLTSLTNNQNLEITAAIPAEERPNLKPGNRIQLLALQGKTGQPSQREAVGEATIFFISPKVDPLSQTVLVKAKLNNPEQRFQAEQRLRARIIWGESDQVMVPAAAVLRMAGQPFVYLAKASAKQPDGYQVSLMPITLGSIENGSYVVKSGLKGDETIVTGGIQKLQEGAMVMEMKPQPGPSAPNSHP